MEIIKKLANINYIIYSIKRFLIAFFPLVLVLVLGLIWLKPKTKLLYTQNSSRYLVDLVKNEIKDDLVQVNPEQLTQEQLDSLSQKIQTSWEEGQQQVGQQIKLEKNKLEVKTSLAGEVIFPLEAGKWQLKASPIDKINIYLPKSKVVVVKEDLGIVFYIPLQEGNGQVIASDQVLPLALVQETILKSSDEIRSALSRYLADPVNPNQKMGLILIFNDQNNNQIFDSTEKLVPWAGVTFNLSK